MANSIDEAYYDWLVTQTAVTALAPVYAQEAFDVALPYIVVFLVDDPNLKQYISHAEQGAARMQHTVWTPSLGVNSTVRATLRRTVDALSAVSGGYTMYCESVNEVYVQRSEATEPYQSVVDAVIRWRL